MGFCLRCALVAALLVTPLPAAAASTGVDYVADGVSVSAQVSLLDGSLATVNASLGVSVPAVDPLSDIGLTVL